ncbi:MAG: cytochrome-c oxidase, cbb3-type subunit III [Alphaproteobacteria bacterium]|nr:cytochrome-c oxidase, cbb3-type subunit III [Alphaproteobacteria bacterium]
MAKNTRQKENQTQTETTGHEWDGIEEYNNPLPLWGLWVFAATVVFSIGYVIYFPAIPFLNSFSKGIGEWSQYKQLDDIMQKAEQAKAPFENKIVHLSAQQIKNTPDLHQYALESGKATFALHCSQCHGAGGGGAKGYPNLLDDEWIWGGRLEDIVYTITHGIRSAHEDENSRDMGPMMAYGDEEILDKAQIKDVAHYLQTLSKKYLKPNESTERGKVIYAENCASCHGEQGSGSQELGAPSLNNAIWLYAGDTKTIIETITHGRAGQMPAFGQKLSENDIKKLSLYIHSLSGGEQ